MDMVRDMNEQTVYPFDQDYKHYVLIEIAQIVDPYDSANSDSQSEYTEVESDRLFGFLEQIEDQILVSFASCLCHFTSNFWRIFYLTGWCSLS